MSIAHTLSSPQVRSQASSPLAAAKSDPLKELRGAVWDFLAETGRRRAEHAMKHGYHMYI